LCGYDRIKHLSLTQDHKRDILRRLLSCHVLQSYDVSFAYIHAVKLAQQGSSVLDKRIGLILFSSLLLLSISYCTIGYFVVFILPYIFFSAALEHFQLFLTNCKYRMAGGSSLNILVKIVHLLTGLLILIK